MGSKRVRAILDKAGLPYVRIVASNDLNEYKIEDLLMRGAPIDAFGVGTDMITARPVAAISGVYKLVEDDGGPKIKLSTEKQTMPGRKQVYRFERAGQYTDDMVARDTKILEGKSLLELAIERGVRVRPQPTLDETRAYVRAEAMKLPEGVRRIKQPDTYPVFESVGLNLLVAELYREHQHHGGETT